MAIVRLEGLGQLKNPITSSGFDPVIFGLVAQCLNELRYRVPLPVYCKFYLKIAAFLVLLSLVSQFDTHRNIAKQSTLFCCTKRGHLAISWLINPILGLALIFIVKVKLSLCLTN
jgi:hypothetical protein